MKRKILWYSDVSTNPILYYDSVKTKKQTSRSKTQKKNSSIAVMWYIYLYFRRLYTKVSSDMSKKQQKELSGVKDQLTFIYNLNIPCSFLILYFVFVFCILGFIFHSKLFFFFWNIFYILISTAIACLQWQ